MRTVSYERAETAAGAVQALAIAGDDARLIAGGTTLFDLMKLNIERPRHLIDVTSIAGMNAIVAGTGIRLGALATMSDVAAHPVVRRDYPVLSQSLLKAASQQLRNMATVGGNLLQRTRCLYFRNGSGATATGTRYPCNKREPGAGCAALDGRDREQAVLGQSRSCTAVSPGDWPVALIALDAKVEVLGPVGSRTLTVEDLYRTPGTTPHLEFNLRPGELVTSIVVPPSRAARRSTYHKIRDRESYAFALASAAVALDLRDGVVAEARIALGGVGTVPWRARTAERRLLGARLDSTSAVAAGRAAMEGAVAGRENGFKIELAARTVTEALLTVAG